MRFFRTEDEKGYDKVKKRLDSVSLPQTQAWANTALWTIQEGLEAGADRAALDQARTNSIALLAAIDSLLDRID